MHPAGKFLDAKLHVVYGQGCRRKNDEDNVVCPSSLSVVLSPNLAFSLFIFTPQDYTPVCTTELGEAAKRKSDFDERGVKLVGFSCNSGESHKGWIEDVKHVCGVDEFDYPLFCDPEREHAVKLGILDASNKDAKGLPLTVRSVYILKPDKTVALIMTYPASTGRNFDVSSARSLCGCRYFSAFAHSIVCYLKTIHARDHPRH